MRAAAKRIGVEAIGWVLVVAGIAALVLPGPGLLMVFGGLAILSQQYEWAERRLAPIKFRALKGAAESVETVPRIVASVVGVVLLVVAGVLWILGPPAPARWLGHRGHPDRLGVHRARARRLQLPALPRRPRRRGQARGRAGAGRRRRQLGRRLTRAGQPRR
jgi:uncharacterized protein (TIGR02611 family)